MIDICAVGFGAIGALYAYCLDKNESVRVTAVCRSNYDVLQEHGLHVESEKFGSTASWMPYRVVRSVAEAADRPYAYVICAFKCVPEVTSTPALLTPLLNGLRSAKTQTLDRPTTFVLLQNGIGIEDDLISALVDVAAPAAVVSGCCWVDTTTVDGGRKITQHGNERLVLGFHRPTSNTGQVWFSEDTSREALDELCTLFQTGGSAVEAAPDTDVARWRKVLWNASFSTICTLTRAHVGAVLALEPSRAALRDIMFEVLAVARASLEPSSLVNEVLSDVVVDAIIEHENAASIFRPSMLVDLDCGRPMEVQAIVGGVLKRARANGVSTPKLDLVYAGLEVIQNGLLKKT
ncbi:ketopantoate reductase PanE/ApbA C terminal-domain-containing protein [Epithele typhae]|uniref:ketopantoate reductase PanE/ApbA C terminal-domain-containing protein n=1 Tax=Epithele typhae TaxID=378194 RepID=UPI002007CD5B|nr:ketopantoate reductase PanE/ApbA C terminal-domain-containing protein [Epithele typhae]KAH9924313.1 ketopantoate reductase PanE/ApbA C terminal-domain-containing protein [Epithele typhae]